MTCKGLIAVLNIFGTSNYINSISGDVVDIGTILCVYRHYMHAILLYEYVLLF